MSTLLRSVLLLEGAKLHLDVPHFALLSRLTVRFALLSLSFSFLNEQFPFDSQDSQFNINLLRFAV